MPHFRPAGFGIEKGLEHPESQQALQTPLARAYLRWSRFPFVQVESVSAAEGIWINDYRYANVATYGWSSVKLR